MLFSNTKEKLSSPPPPLPPPPPCDRDGTSKAWVNSGYVTDCRGRGGGGGGDGGRGGGQLFITDPDAHGDLLVNSI